MRRYFVLQMLVWVLILSGCDFTTKNDKEIDKILLDWEDPEKEMYILGEKEVTPHQYTIFSLYHGISNIDNSLSMTYGDDYAVEGEIQLYYDLIEIDLKKNTVSLICQGGYFIDEWGDSNEVKSGDILTVKYISTNQIKFYPINRSLVEQCWAMHHSNNREVIMTMGTIDYTNIIFPIEYR